MFLPHGDKLNFDKIKLKNSDGNTTTVNVPKKKRLLGIFKRKNKTQ